ncbi:hypothetical protein F2P56_022869 [Juglans regia]|uniref:UPF0481 protein At3g47200-like isoform X1 n=2 Tax=Juglans regia TaxID=51240 RepID=A0A2I4DXV3_JUGRE|nr:UPF0481 protein At3g47200-like isoform X1 [Juglans regia]XP_018811990.1 UPF0481 protein At3g47200-like isoform X1 [Juglans regia]KAF5458873.1 hypothetical protein F2P56_022869 [Juglans regia]
MGQSYGTYFQRNDQNASADQEEHLVIRITQLLENSRHHYLPGECCIYKVPYHLHKLNEEAYTPQVISIGPFHHGKKKFQILEKYKVRYLDDFMRRAETNLENLVRIVKGSEAAIHQCYAETIELDSDEFVTMILLDAAFIIEYFLRDMFPMQWTDEDRTVIKPWITARMQLDFLLLENQLPFFILNDLYQLVLVTHSLYRPFTEVASRYFGFLNTQNKSSDSYEFNGIIHFVDLIRIFYLPPPGTLSERRSDSKVEKIYCATQLAEAGLTFKKSESQCYLDLKYHEGGVLKIPCFTIDNTTQIFARNLMALEQCHYPTQAYVTDYFLLLDFLIDTGKDVALLAEKNILVNGMGDDNATFINNLGTNVQYSSMNPEYCRLCRDIVEFHDSNWNRWKAILKRDHFSTPWRVVATIAAILLLAFTLTQAVCSIISVLPSKRRNL